MRSLFTKDSHDLVRGEILSGIAEQAKTLRITSGLAWVTVEGMPEDHWLCNGAKLLVPPGRLIVIEAEKGVCRIDIQPAMTPHLFAGPPAGIGRQKPSAQSTPAM
jgi:hypothetical protein